MTSRNKLIMICGMGASLGMVLWMLVGGVDLTATAIIVFIVCVIVAYGRALIKAEDSRDEHKAIDAG